MPEWHREDWILTTDRYDLEAAGRFLRDSYWAKDRAASTIRQSFQSSTVFALYRGEDMVGMARVVSDGCTFAWLCDVYLEPAVRGNGLGTWIVGTVLGSGLFGDSTRWYLATKDAHRLYAKFGFTPLEDPGQTMTRRLKAGRQGPR